MPFGEEWDQRNRRYKKQAEAEARKAERQSAKRWLLVMAAIVILVLLFRYHVL